jgi:hypothetical protein
MIQKPLLWVEVGKSACVLVGICELRLSLPARYDPQCPPLLDFLKAVAIATTQATKGAVAWLPAHAKARLFYFCLPFSLFVQLQNALGMNV